MNAPIGATGEAMPVAITYTLPKSGIRLNITMLACGRITMFGGLGRAGRAS